MAYNIILVACYIKTVALKMTGFSIIIICRVRAVGFEITGLTVAIIKLKSFLKRIIGIYITGG
jgi:hypothetical protein